MGFFTLTMKITIFQTILVYKIFSLYLNIIVGDFIGQNSHKSESG